MRGGRAPLRHSAGRVDHAREPASARIYPPVGAPAAPEKRPRRTGGIRKTSPIWRTRRCPRRLGACRWRCGARREPDRKTVRGRVSPAKARVGQQGTPTRLRARKGIRPRAPKDCRDAWADIFGAVCPARATGAARAALTSPSGSFLTPAARHAPSVAGLIVHGSSVPRGGAYRRPGTCRSTWLNSSVIAPAMAR